MFLTNIYFIFLPISEAFCRPSSNSPSVRPLNYVDVRSLGQHIYIYIAEFHICLRQRAVLFTARIREEDALLYLFVAYLFADVTMSRSGPSDGLNFVKF